MQYLAEEKQNGTVVNNQKIHFNLLYKYNKQVHLKMTHFEYIVWRQPVNFASYIYFSFLFMHSFFILDSSINTMYWSP